jgi:hypothetical protein
MLNYRFIVAEVLGAIAEPHRAAFAIFAFSVASIFRP